MALNVRSCVEKLGLSLQMPKVKKKNGSVFPQKPTNMFWFDFICKFVIIIIISLGFVGFVMIFFLWLLCFLLVSKLSNFQFSVTSSTGKHALHVVYLLSITLPASPGFCFHFS